MVVTLQVLCTEYLHSLNTSTISLCVRSSFNWKLALKIPGGTLLFPSVPSRGPLLHLRAIKLFLWCVCCVLVGCFNIPSVFFTWWILSSPYISLPSFHLFNSSSFLLLFTLHSRLEPLLPTSDHHNDFHLDYPDKQNPGRCAGRRGQACQQDRRSTPVLRCRWCRWCLCGRCRSPVRLGEGAVADGAERCVRECDGCC